jgi:hypothetical protein
LVRALARLFGSFAVSHLLALSENSTERRRNELFRQAQADTKSQQYLNGIKAAAASKGLKKRM